jgi:hypothetical protein
MPSTRPAEKLIGHRVYVIRTKLDAGEVNAGLVTGVDRYGRALVETAIGTLALPMSELTTDIARA